MNLAKKVIIILLFVLFFCGYSFCDGQGTTIFQTLQLPLTAYDASIANTFVSAISSPATVPFLQNSVILSHAIYLVDTSYTVLGGNYNINEKSGINFSFLYFNYGSMDKYLDDGSGGYIRQGSFEANDKLFLVSYAQNFNDKISCGLSLKYLTQTIDDVSYNGYALHLSGLYFINDNFFVIAGLNNIGPKVEDYNLPTNVYLGLSGYLTSQLLAIGQLDNYYNDCITELKLALEYKPVKIFLCRFGYAIPIQKEVADENELITNLTLGVGLQFSAVTVDYAWLPKGDLGSVHMFSFIYKFGQGKE